MYFERKGVLYQLPSWGSKYRPHQGKAEQLRRRQGGNAMRRRMEAAGMRWDDAKGRYV